MITKNLFEGYSILITDDNGINRLVVEIMLKELKVPVYEAEDGEKAMSIIHALGNIPLILLLDLNMPVMDGYEVIYKLKSQASQYENVRIIVISGSPYSKFIESGLEKYILGYVEKPVSKEELMKKMQDCVSQEV